MDPIRSQARLSCKTGSGDLTTDSVSTPGSANLARALMRYNSVKAVAEANHARWHETALDTKLPQPQDIICQTTQPGEFTSAEVGVLGANVSQLQSAPDVWFSGPSAGCPVTAQDSVKENIAGTANRVDKLTSGQAEAALKANWTIPAVGASSAVPKIDERLVSNQTHPFGLLLREGFWDCDMNTAEALNSARYQSVTTGPPEDATALQARLARIDLANETELQSSHTYHHSWPASYNTEASHAINHNSQPASHHEDFSPLQSSTMQLQARYWPRGFANHASFKASQYAQRSPPRQHARSASWSVPETKEHLRESADSTEAMLGNGASGMPDDSKRGGLWSRFCGCAKKQTFSPQRPAPQSAEQPRVPSERFGSHTAKLVKALRSKNVQVWDLIDANNAENAVLNFQSLSKVPIIPDDFGPTGPLEECAGAHDGGPQAESDTIPAIIVDRDGQDLEESGWVTKRYADFIDAGDHFGPSQERESDYNSFLQGNRVW